MTVHLDPIFARLKLPVALWVAFVRNFRKRFLSGVGRAELMPTHAGNHGHNPEISTRSSRRAFAQERNGAGQPEPGIDGRELSPTALQTEALKFPQDTDGGIRFPSQLCRPSFQLFRAARARRSANSG